MSTESQAPVPMVNVQIDGQWLQFAKGTRVIDACQQAGAFIPHYCYHPKLSTPGNCRMCMVEMGMPKMGPDRKPILGTDGKPEIGWIPRPQISCAQEVSEGLAVRTGSPMVQDARKGVMEFLLINHPLDCPICDQAGECHLQEYSVEYGTGNSRFLENKVKKPKHEPIGPRVTLDAERCILCTRCIRFMREVANDDVLGIVERGTFNTIACHPDRALDSNYSLNTVDLCPVGALTSTDFRFKMRVWFLKETNSICTSCSTGCNTTIGSRQNVVYRQTPRENNDVNQTWMCDYGRLNFRDLHHPDRLVEPFVNGQQSSWKEAIAQAAALLKKAGKPVSILVSGKETNEELFLIKKIAAALNTDLIDLVPDVQTGDDLLLSADRNPNSAGATLLGLATGRLPQIRESIQNGKTATILAIGAGAVSAISTTQGIASVSLITLGILPDTLKTATRVLLPSAGFAEKRGTMINKKGRIQRLNQAIPLPGNARDDWEILSDLLSAVSSLPHYQSVDEIFRELAANTPALANLSHSKIGDQGIQLTLTHG